MVSEEKNFKNQPIRNKSLVAAMLVNRSGQNEQSLQRTFHRCFLPSFGSFGQVFSEEKILKNLYRDKCIYRYLYLNKSYLSINRRYFRNQPIWNKNCLWQPCLLTNWDKMSNLYRGPSNRCFLPSFSSFGWGGFLRRGLKCDRRRMPSDGKSSHCLWQGELKSL